MNSKYTALFRMARTSRVVTLVCALTAGSVTAFAQGFNAGSTGVLGDVVIDADTQLDLPADGVLNYRTLRVNANATLSFNRNARNTPVFILSQGDVVINGNIDISGFQSRLNNGGVGGPGGFDGGKPGFAGQVPAGNGYGPGGGSGGADDSCDNPQSPGQGAYGGRRSFGPNHGAIYGSSLLINLVGGSGGGGGNDAEKGGGGGGGALLISANTRIALNGLIKAQGGANRVCVNSGSGGAVRLVATKVEGAGTINTQDGNGNAEGRGRIRVDAIDLSGLSVHFQPDAARTVGSNLISFAPLTPRLETIEVAGNAVPPGSPGPTFFLPFNSTTNRTVRIQARDFKRVVPIDVVLTPNSGPVRRFQAEIDNTSVNPAVVEVPVTVPVNTLVTVHAWTR